jgi:hypothetical protein
LDLQAMMLENARFTKFTGRPKLSRAQIDQT